jgi:hypothetical protein
MAKDFNGFLIQTCLLLVQFLSAPTLSSCWTGGVPASIVTKLKPQFAEMEYKMSLPNGSHVFWLLSSIYSFLWWIWGNLGIGISSLDTGWTHSFTSALLWGLSETDWKETNIVALWWSSSANPGTMVLPFIELLSLGVWWQEVKYLKWLQQGVQISTKQLSQLWHGDSGEFKQCNCQVKYDACGPCRPHMRCQWNNCWRLIIAFGLSSRPFCWSYLNHPIVSCDHDPIAST